MIVFEGCDCAGKTYLAENIALRFLTLGRLTRFEKYGLLPAWWDYKYHYISSCKEYAVLDRFIVSEYVYGRLWRNGPNEKLTCTGLSAIIEHIRTLPSALTVYVRPSYQTVMKRMKQRGEKLLHPRDVRKVMSMFDEYLNHELCRVTEMPMIQVSGENIEADSDKILQAYFFKG